MENAWRKNIADILNSTDSEIETIKDKLESQEEPNTKSIRRKR